MRCVKTVIVRDILENFYVFAHIFFIFFAFFTLVNSFLTILNLHIPFISPKFPANPKISPKVGSQNLRQTISPNQPAKVFRQTEFFEFSKFFYEF